jgi:hypothetical protein
MWKSGALAPHSGNAQEEQHGFSSAIVAARMNRRFRR